LIHANETLRAYKRDLMSHSRHVSPAMRGNIVENDDRNPYAAKARRFFAGVADLPPHACEIALEKRISESSQTPSGVHP
jgi:hypothetical protein